ncbi:pyruvate phosphate dikinase, PEP/pyruvate binding domain protein [Mycobacterium xenopi 3993]|nr:pyruvate phosphate dikinase, PEP/pyruvate binding domain protein [Mycobacterium xenopi 3993]
MALDGTANLPREIVGNKGFGIDAMRRLRLPVPPAFCITREASEQFFADPASGIDCIWDTVVQKIRWLERETSRTFGRGPNRCWSVCGPVRRNRCPACSTPS